MNKIWKDNEKKFIKDNADKMKDRELAESLSKISGRHISVQAVRKQRQKLGIQKAHGRGICKLVGQEKKSSSNIARGVPVAQPKLGD